MSTQLQVTPTLAQDAQALKVLKAERDEAKAQAKDLEAQYKAAEREFMDRLEAEGVDGIKTDGINFVPAETIYGEIQDRAEFVTWAQVHEPELIEYKERAELINRKARELLDDGEPFPPGLNFRKREYISQRAA